MRVVDVLMALIAGVILAPAAAIVAAAIKLDSPGPVLFGQTRVGRWGVEFTLWKFRTMRVREAEGPLITVGRDERITRMGRLLRARRIDEWPQLLNVLLGHMSFVGPRPEVPRYVAAYPPEIRNVVLSVRPGITDPAALQFRDESARLTESPDPERTYLTEILPEKLDLQASYVKSRTIWSDMTVILKTIAVIAAK